MVLTTMGHGGVPEVVYQLMRHVPPDRCTPFLCVLKREEDEDNVNATQRERFAAAGFDVHYASDSSSKLETVAAVAQWIEARGIEVLHTHSNRPNVIGRTAGLLCGPSGPRLVAHYHNQYDDKWERDPMMLAFERRLARSTDAFVAVSQSVCDHVAERVGIAADRIDVVGNGVEFTRFVDGDRDRARASFGVPKDVLLVGLVGRVTEQKGHEDFVEAALRLRATRPDVVFAAFGFAEDAPLHERLLARIAAEGAADTIRLVGNRDDMPDVYAALDLVVAPSRWEGFGIMLVEAMAAGRAIVATRTGAIPEIVKDGETAVLVEPRDPAALADAIAKLLDAPAERSRLGIEGRRRATTFSWKATAERMVRIYERVTERRSSVATR